MQTNAGIERCCIPGGLRISACTSLILCDYLKIFIGKDTHDSNMDGNSILVQLGLERYMVIGSSIYEFMTNETILDYISEIANSDVPYPYIIGEKNVYLAIEYVYFPKNLCTCIYDCYGVYYGHIKDDLYDEAQVKGMDYVSIVDRM